MQDGRGSGSICWTRASCIAALVSGAVACLLLGMLGGVMAAGGHASDVIPAITDPVTPAPAQADTAGHRHRQTLAHTVTVTVAGSPSTRTVTVTRPPVTVSHTVTVTSTETVTEPPTTPSGTTGAAP